MIYYLCFHPGNILLQISSGTAESQSVRPRHSHSLRVRITARRCVFMCVKFNDGAWFETGAKGVCDKLPDMGQNWLRRYTYMQQIVHQQLERFLKSAAIVTQLRYFHLDKFSLVLQQCSSSETSLNEGKMQAGFKKMYVSQIRWN